MRALVQDGYGDPARVLRIADVPPPTLEHEDSVLVRVAAASVNAGDWRRVRGSPLFLRASEGLRRPRDPKVGVDAAGIVEEVGPAVSHLKPGDEVYGMRLGAFADLVAGRTFEQKPANLSFELAAAVPAAGVTALQAVRDHGRVQPGDRVLVLGAGGGVGSFAVQLAIAFGATVVAGTRADRAARVAALGPADVIDHASADLTAHARRYDVVVDAAGRQPIGALLRCLAPGGRLALLGAGHGLGGPLGRFAAAAVRSKVLRQPVRAFIAAQPGFRENLRTLRELIEAGRVAPMIDRCIEPSAIPEAVSLLEVEGATGKVVVRWAG